VGAKTSDAPQVYLDSQKFPPSILPKYMNTAELDFFDIDPMEIARQVALIEHSLYRCIQPMECLNQSWNKSRKVGKKKRKKKKKKNDDLPPSIYPSPLLSFFSSSQTLHNVFYLPKGNLSTQYSLLYSKVQHL
jgi:hypothetical protein